MVDPLTGTYNRSWLETNAASIFQKARKSNTYIGMEIFDIDCFKQYNDTYGHQRGDDCLRTIAECLRAYVKEYPGTYLARYGGDEFIILFDNYTDENICVFSEGIRARIKELNIENPNSHVSPYLTISQGIYNASFETESDPARYLFRADEALYHVKEKMRGNYYLISDKDKKAPK